MELTRRNFMKSTAAAGALLLVAPLLTGCPVTQSQLAQLVAEIGTALASILPYFKTVSADAATKIEASFQALESTIQAWVPGTAIADIEQAVNAFVANMALIPVLAAYQPLVALIVATAEGIITLLVPNAAPKTQAVQAATQAAAQKYPHPPKTAGAFRREWNRQAKAVNRLDLVVG